MELTIPSSLDPTLCSSGKHVCLIFSQYTKYNLKNGREWNDETKKEYADLVIILWNIILIKNIVLVKFYFQVFNCVEAYAPGFKDSIIGYEVLPPPELERIFGLTGGVSLLKFSFLSNILYITIMLTFNFRIFITENPLSINFFLIDPLTGIQCLLTPLLKDFFYVVLEHILVEE